MNTIRKNFEAAIAAVHTSEQLEQLRVQYLGRKGIITLLAKDTDFSQLSPDEKKHFGANLNELKNFATAAIQAAAETFKNSQPVAVKPKGLDLTQPSGKNVTGSLHPISLVQMELESIFEGMGFSVLAGPEVESEYFNFESLNIPSDHPARDMQDTFWLTSGAILRTHTSANQVRTMKRFGAPLRAIFPGKCFRYEAIDPSHENTFYQCEGLVIDRNISVANLIGVMKTILSEVFKRDVTVRLRPGFFPFVEPGFELDLQCLLCDGKGCSTCGDGWIELIPCGLVHPAVLRHGGIDPNEYSGFAFGLGLTRLAMMKYGVRDIRHFNSGDLRFYEQFAVV